MQQAGVHGRHLDRNGEFSRKHGNELARTQRKVYGDLFALEFDDHSKSSDVLATLDEPSLSPLVHDHEHSHLAGKIAAQAYPSGYDAGKKVVGRKRHVPTDTMGLLSPRSCTRPTFRTTTAPRQCKHRICDGIAEDIPKLQYPARLGTQENG